MTVEKQDVSSAPDASVSPAPPVDSAELLDGLHRILQRIGVAVTNGRDVAALAYGLAEALINKGIIDLDELTGYQQEAVKRQSERLSQQGMTVSLTENAPDKYAMDEQAVEIDCADRLPLCRAACCRFRFALTLQDLEERVVQWSLSEPYLNRQTADGYCAHLNGELGCGIYHHRPAICRSYDCRSDKRVWQDFEARIPSPELPALLAETPNGGPGRRRVPLPMPRRREPAQAAPTGGPVAGPTADASGAAEGSTAPDAATR